ncbi:MAG: glycosyltransferase [Nitrospinota bacterium]|nr:glycosyltransferase [Nitrospinota bacterium]
MKKKLLLFASTFPRWEDDTEIPRFVFELGVELRRYFEVYALAPHTPGAAKSENLDGIQVIRFTYFYPESKQNLAYGTGMMASLKSNPWAFLQVPSFLFCQWRALRRTVREYNIDIVNSHWMIPQGFIASLPPQLNCKQVLTIHAAGLFALRRLPLGKRMARRMVRRSDLIYSVSSYNQQILEQLVRHKVDCRILPMGIDTYYYENHSDPATLRKELGLPSGKIILYVGKLNEKKGVIYLLKAFQLISQDQSDCHLVIVGTGLLDRALRRESERLKLDSRITFAGQQGKEAVKNYFQAADLVVVPSIIDSTGETEGLPVVLLEALACGKPVVATRVAGAPDVIVDGHNGFLAKPEDGKDLADKMKQALKANAGTLSKNARDSVQKYDWEMIGKDYRDRILGLFD